MSSPYEMLPEPYFKGYADRIIISNDGLTGLNVGYECCEWRYEAFADYLFDWLLEFATRFSDLKQLNVANARRMIHRAAELVYNTDKYKRRGEFGELMLHAILRELFGTEPAVSKLFYKTASNDTVKGFDSVHVRKCEGGTELWLGEAKFYQDVDAAISEVSKEIKCHLEAHKLRQEFMCIGNHIDPSWEHAQCVKDLMRANRSLDEIFKTICLPVLLTYESETVGSGRQVSDEFVAKLCAEFSGIEKSFKEKVNGASVRVRLILLPLASKSKFLEVMHAKLKGLQA